MTDINHTIELKYNQLIATNMNLQTGEIISEDKLEEILKLKGESEIKKYVPLNEELAEKLKGMNRHNRRKYYALHKEEFNY